MFARLGTVSPGPSRVLWTERAGPRRFSGAPARTKSSAFRPVTAAPPLIAAWLVPFQARKRKRKIRAYPASGAHGALPGGHEDSRPWRLGQLRVIFSRRARWFSTSGLPPKTEMRASCALRRKSATSRHGVARSPGNMLFGCKSVEASRSSYPACARSMIVRTSKPCGRCWAASFSPARRLASASHIDGTSARLPGASAHEPVPVLRYHLTPRGSRDHEPNLHDGGTLLVPDTAGQATAPPPAGRK